MLCYVMLCYVTLCYVILCYVMLYCATLCYVMLCYVILCYVMLCHIMSYYVMLCYAVLCYVTSCYFILCNIMLFHVMFTTVKIESCLKYNDGANSHHDNISRRACPTICTYIVLYRIECKYITTRTCSCTASGRKYVNSINKSG